MPALMKFIIPVIESKTWSPVWSVKNCLNGTGKVCETIAHKEEPADINKRFQLTAVSPQMQNRTNKLLKLLHVFFYSIKMTLHNQH